MAAYEFKQGSHIKADPNAAGRMCEELEAKGNLTAKSFLDANRPENAPCHNCFNWNDSEAAELYREGQARHIISCLCIKREDPKQEQQRQFFKIEYESPRYQSVNVILRSPDSTEALFKTALNELAAFQRKYSALKKLARVFEAIDQVRFETE